MKLLVCIGPRCDAEGRGSALLENARAMIAATFPGEIADGRLRIETRDCLRLCTRDPVVRIEPSGEAISNPRLDELQQLIAQELVD